MKKMLGILLLFSASFGVFANIPPFKTFDHSQKGIVYQWSFNDEEDGMFFLLGPESQHFLIFHVNPLTANGAISDPIIVYCNASKYRVTAGTELNCYGNFHDVIHIGISPEDVKNGSAGTYTYIDN